MTYDTKKYPLEGKLDGISDEQIKQHRDNLYTGYVKKINEIETNLEKADRGSANGVYSSFGELKREETFALNGVVLHEWYFENMGGDGGEPKGTFKECIERDFDNWDNFVEDFRATAVCARGWVLTAFNFRDGKIHNYLLDTHHFHVPVGVWPLLVLDVYEHAYFIDYGTKRPGYIDAFMNNIDWEVVNKRCDVVQKVTGDLVAIVQ